MNWGISQLRSLLPLLPSFPHPTPVPAGNAAVGGLGHGATALAIAPIAVIPNFFIRITLGSLTLVPVLRAGDAAVVEWGMLAGYEQQKGVIEDTLLLALLHPDTFDDVARGTRKHFASNRPRAVLFEGPPGCGKTTSARRDPRPSPSPSLALDEKPPYVYNIRAP